MWPKKFQTYLFVITLSSTLVAFFGCSQAGYDRNNVARKQGASVQPTEPEEIQIEVQLKDDPQELSTQAVNEAPIQTAQASDVPAQCPNPNMPNCGLSTDGSPYGAAVGGPGALSYPGALGYGGGLDYGAPGLWGAPGWGDGIGPFGFGLDFFNDDFFGPGIPFFVSDFIVNDDDDHNHRHHRHHRNDNRRNDNRDDDNTSGDDDDSAR